MKTRFVIGFGHSVLSFGFQRPFVKRIRTKEFVMWLGPDRKREWS